MRCIFLACFLTVLLLVSNASSQQEHKDATIPFPLPTREMRLIEEAQDPKSPMSHLLELLKSGPSQKVREAAAQALAERADVSVLPELEKLKSPAPGISNSDITAAIEQIRIRQGIATPTASKAQADTAVENLLANPVSQQDFDQGDYHKFRRYSQRLLDLAEAKDQRAFDFIEKYFEIFRHRFHATDNPINNDSVLDEYNSRLEKAYWELKLQGMTLQQKVATFVKVGSNPDQATVPFYTIESVFAELGQPVVLPLLLIFQDKKTPDTLRKEAGRILMQVPNSTATGALAKIADDPADNEQIRELALVILGRYGHPKAVSSILTRLALGAKTIQEGKSVTEDATSALWATENLAKAGTAKEKLEAAILPYLLAADWKKGSHTAALVARQVGSDMSVKPLINMVENGTAPDDMRQTMMRRGALTSLGFVGQRARDSTGELLTFLINKVYDKDPLTRIPAVQALSRIGKQLAIPILLDIIKKEQDHSALWFEVSGIYVAGGETAVKALQELKQFAQENKNAWLVELTEEGLLRLEREKRTGQVGQAVTSTP